MRISSDNHHIRIIADDCEAYRILMCLSDAVHETVALACGGQLPVGPKYRSNLEFTPVLGG